MTITTQKLFARQSLSFLFLLFVTSFNGQATTINITSGGDVVPNSGINGSISSTTLTTKCTVGIQPSVIETTLASGNLTVISGTGSESIIQVDDPIAYTDGTKKALNKIGSYGKYIALTAIGTYIMLHPKKAQDGSPPLSPLGFE